MGNGGQRRGRRVGELAAASGLTVRSLHYYEEIGLLVASERSDAGHRLYAEADVDRLYRICLLRRLGLPLEEIGKALDDPGWSLRSAMAVHLRELDRHLEVEGRLRARLAQLAAAIDGSEAATTDDLLDLLDELSVLDAPLQRRIPILVYADLETAFGFLVRVFRLGPGQLSRDSDGNAVHGELDAGDGVIWLHPELARAGFASPQSTRGVTASMAVMVDDVDAHYRHALNQGAHIESEPRDQPYGYREYSTRDSEGGFWSFMKPLE